MPQVPQQTKLLNPKINWGNPITHGLVFDVPLWEGTGNIAEDDANLLGFLGTFKNSPTWATSIFGNEMKFGSNGGNAALTFNLPANASDTTLMSYEAIVRINSGALQYQRPIHVGSLDYPSNRWDLEFDNSWGWVFASPRSGGSDGKWSVTRPSNSVYHHIVITMDWSSNSNNPSFYIDGIRQTITVRNAPTLTPASDNGVLQIGNNSVNFNQGWGDSVVYTRLWNRLLTANEAWSLYTNPWQIYLKPNLNLAYWLVAPAQAAVIASVVNPTLLFMGVG